MVGAEEDIVALAALADGDSDGETRLCALGGMGRLGDETALGRLDVALGSGSIDERETAVESLALIGSQAAINRVIDALPRFEDSAGVVPNVALEALVALGEQARGSVALRVLESTGTQLRLCAQVLGVIGAETDLAALREVRERTTDPTLEAALDDAIASIEGRSGR